MVNIPTEQKIHETLDRNKDERFVGKELVSSKTASYAELLVMVADRDAEIERLQTENDELRAGIEFHYGKSHAVDTPRWTQEQIEQHNRDAEMIASKMRPLPAVETNDYRRALELIRDEDIPQGMSAVLFADRVLTKTALDEMVKISQEIGGYDLPEKTNCDGCIEFAKMQQDICTRLGVAEDTDAFHLHELTLSAIDRLLGETNARRSAFNLLTREELIESCHELAIEVDKLQSVKADTGTHDELRDSTNAMCAWAESLAAIVGWTRENASSFYAARDAARKIANNSPEKTSCEHARITSLDSLPPIITCMDCGADLSDQKESAESCLVHTQPGHPFADCTCSSPNGKGTHDGN